MTRQKRIEYLIVTGCIFISAFLLFFLIISFAPIRETPTTNQMFLDNRILFGVLFGLVGGYMFSAVVSSIILASNFFKKKSLTFKIVASVLFLITYICIIYAGIFSYLPYQIYNIIKIIQDKPVPTENQINQ